MIRVPTFTNTELVKRTLDTLPKGIREKLGQVDFWFAIDPLFGGLHGFDDTGDGRSYRNTSHCNYEHHVRDRRTTVALLDGDENDELVILHELGHVLDERLGWDHPDIAPMNAYAATNSHEAFAVAFQSYYTFGENKHFFHTRAQVLEKCPDAAAFFRQLEGET